MRLKGNLLVLVIFFCISVSVSGAYAAEPLKQISQWGIEVADTGGPGVLVKTVQPSSSAESAGLQAGDMLLSVNGAAVKSLQEFMAVKDTFPLYTPVNLAVKRNEAIIERQILLAGIVSLELKEVKSEFVIPGVPLPAISAGLSAIDSLEVINVLDQVIFDTKSGKIAIIGHYDKEYNTGPIPYLDLLKTALVYPAPRISLDPDPDSVKQMLEITPIIQNAWSKPNMRATLNQMFDVVQGHPDTERERQILIQELSTAYGLSPEEYVTWYNYVLLEKNKEAFPPPLIRDIQIKVFRNLGYVDFAKAMELTFQKTPTAAAQALQVAGGGEEARAIIARSGANSDAALGELMVSVYLHILPRVVALGPKEEADFREAYSSGRMTWQTVLASVQGRLFPIHTNNLVNLKNLAFMKVIIPTPAALLIAKAKPFYSLIRPTDLDRNSQMSRILYEADYALKSLSVTPDMFRKIPGFLAISEYNRQNPGGVHTRRFWFEPKMVAMDVSSERNLIAFGSSQMLLKNENANDLFGTPSEKDNTRYDAWCAHVMNNYDHYARLLPSFHKLREAAKVIALAKWILAEKTNLDLSGVTQEKWSMPDKVPGFFTLKSEAKQLSTGEQSIVPSLSQDSGVSFNPKGSWTQISSTPSITTEVSSQLALSASLGKQAVQAALSGKLESARYLAEMSAQAMNGSLSKSDLDKVIVIMPQGVTGPVAPENVLLQKEMLKQTYKQIKMMTQNPSQRGEASSTLNQLATIYDQVRSNPVTASDFLIKLQARQVSSTALAAAEPANQPIAQSGAKTPGGDKQPAAALTKADKVLGIPWGASDDEARRILLQRPNTKAYSFMNGKDANTKWKGYFGTFADFSEAEIWVHFYQEKMWMVVVSWALKEEQVMDRFNAVKQGLTERYGASMSETGKNMESFVSWDLGGGYALSVRINKNTVQYIAGVDPARTHPFRVNIFYFNQATAVLLDKTAKPSGGSKDY